MHLENRRFHIISIYEVDKSSAALVTRMVTYYPSGEMRINTTLYYILKDYLSPASMVTDESEGIEVKQR